MADILSVPEPSPAAEEAQLRAQLEDREESLRDALERLESRLRDEVRVGPKIAAALDEHIETIVLGGWLLGFWLGSRSARIPR